MNTKYQSKQNHLLYNCHLWATCFDALGSSSGPTKTDPRLSKCIMHSGIPECTIHLDNLGSILCRAWRWLDRVETCSPEVAIIY